MYLGLSARASWPWSAFRPGAPPPEPGRRRPGWPTTMPGSGAASRRLLLSSGYTLGFARLRCGQPAAGGPLLCLEPRVQRLLGGTLNSFLRRCMRMSTGIRQFADHSLRPPRTSLLALKPSVPRQPPARGSTPGFGWRSGAPGAGAALRLGGQTPVHSCSGVCPARSSFRVPGRIHLLLPLIFLLILAGLTRDVERVKAPVTPGGS